LLSLAARANFDNPIGPFIQFNPAIRAIPFGSSTWNIREANTFKVKPFFVTITILAAYHGPKADVSTKTIAGFIWVDFLQNAIFIDANILALRT